MHSVQYSLMDIITTNCYKLLASENCNFLKLRLLPLDFNTSCTSNKENNYQVLISISSKSGLCNTRRKKIKGKTYITVMWYRKAFMFLHHQQIQYLLPCKVAPVLSNIVVVSCSNFISFIPCQFSCFCFYMFEDCDVTQGEKKSCQNLQWTIMNLEI